MNDKISEEHTGLSSSYYGVHITNPTTEGKPEYYAECNDIIEALKMNFAEANVFKAIWRNCAAKALGKYKKGNDAVYDAEKTVFFSGRVLVMAKAEDAKEKEAISSVNKFLEAKNSCEIRGGVKLDG